MRRGMLHELDLDEAGRAKHCSRAHRNHMQYAERHKLEAKLNGWLNDALREPEAGAVLRSCNQ